jgi:hypothetical protein
MIGRGLLLLCAIAAAVVPWPAAAVERWYSSDLYLRMQGVVTPVSNLVPFALLDVAVALLICGGVALFIRRARERGGKMAVLLGLRTGLVFAAAGYLAFLAMWGLNYRRVPLDQKLDYEVSRVSREGALRLGSEAARLVNEGYAAAHATAPDDGALAAAFAEAQRIMGASRLAVPGAPKASLAGLYFRRAAISGMTVPFFLEITLNPDLLPVERPFTLAHEWAHLAGYADESEANFIAWLTCARGDARARYSGWLETYQYVAGSLGREDRRALAGLEAGPRADIRAMRARYERSSPVVREAAREVYDSYLRANRVEEGIASYSLVLRLMLGSRFDEAWTPRMKGP